METKSASVRTDCTVHLDPKSAVDLHFAQIIYPRHAEHDHPLGLHQTLQDSCFLIARFRLYDGHDRIEDFASRLMELQLSWVLRHNCFHEVVGSTRRSMVFFLGGSGPFSSFVRHFLPSFLVC